MRIIGKPLFPYRFFFPHCSTITPRSCRLAKKMHKIFSLTVKRATDNCQKMVQLPQDLIELIPFWWFPIFRARPFIPETSPGSSKRESPVSNPRSDYRRILTLGLRRGLVTSSPALREKGLIQPCWIEDQVSDSLGITHRRRPENPLPSDTYPRGAGKR